MTRALVWGGLAAALALTGLRASGWDGPFPLPAAVALTPYLAVGVAGLLVVAVAGRMTLPAAVAALLAAVQLVWLLPRFTAEPEDAATGAAGRFRVMAANVLVDGAEADELVAAVRAELPDVLALVELTPGLAAGLDRAGLRQLLPFQELDPRRHPGGVGLYARRPLGAGQPLGGTSLPCRQAAVDLAGGQVEVLAVHVYPPRPAATGLWRSDLETIRASAAGNGRPLVVLGDFNASSDHAGFRALEAAGLRDAHEARGRGLVRTWPAKGPLPPLFHLDHVLVSPDLAVLGVHERTVAGSDHRAVVADLALRQR